MYYVSLLNKLTENQTKKRVILRWSESPYS